MLPNRIIWPSLLLIAILVPGCALLPVTPTREADAPGLIATQTPEIPTTPEPTPESMAQVVEYPEFGLRFVLPPGIQMVEREVSGDMLLFLGFGSDTQAAAGQPLASLGIRVFEKPVENGLLDWFTARQGDCYERGAAPPAGKYFTSPIIESQEPFNGNPALQYLSGCWPIPYEKVIEHGGLVIGLYYLHDYPTDYAREYEQLLSSLELLEPLSVAQATPDIAPSPTPFVCLDKSAQPLDVPPRQAPLQVQFVSDGNLYIWQESDQQAFQISDTGDAHVFSFSPDGSVILFERGDLHGQRELWAIERDGSNLRRLVSAEQFYEMIGEPTTLEFDYIDSASWFNWLEGERLVSFEALRAYNAIGGCCDSGGYWQLDVDTGELASWSPPPELTGAPSGLLSPDGSQVALSGETSLTLANVDGSNRREDVLTYPYIAQQGGGFIGPILAWAPDSGSLTAITYSEDVWSDDATFTTWYVPVDGSPAQALATFTGFPFSVYRSPSLDYLAYWRVERPQSNERELHIALFDGSMDIVYARGYLVDFRNWAPDGVHFVFSQGTTGALLSGSVCGEARPLLDPPELPIMQMTWLDAQTFIFVKGHAIEPRGELRLGTVDGGSRLIGPFNGEGATYRVVPSP
jgi:hypothetical protein